MLSSLSVQPNPFTDQVDVTVQQNISCSTAFFKINDVHGHETQNYKLHEEENKLQIRSKSLKPGVYSVQIQGVLNQLIR
jgi:methionine-rich copper-binding protein CopC